MSYQEARMFEEYKRDMRLKARRQEKKKVKLEKLINSAATMIIGVIITISYLQIIGIDTIY